MAEKIGLISDSQTAQSPDVHFAQRDRASLDAQARFLEESGIADYLRVAAEVIPGASFYYNDQAGIHSGELLPGYTLLGREFERRASRFTTTPAVGHHGTKEALSVRQHGSETVMVGVTIIPDIKNGILKAFSHVRHLSFKFDSGIPAGTFHPSIEYMNPGFATATTDRKQMVENLFGYVDNTGLVPTEDKPQVMKTLAARHGQL